jgi:hypothetical protein
MCKLMSDDMALKLIADASRPIADDIRASAGAYRVWLVASNSVVASIVALAWYFSALI